MYVVNFGRDPLDGHFPALMEHVQYGSLMDHIIVYVQEYGLIHDIVLGSNL